VSALIARAGIAALAAETGASGTDDGDPEDFAPRE
jgi:hypothetical protein